MLNFDLKPWNIFNDFEEPELGISGNVLLEGNEWYNSYMPFFFKLSDFDVALRLKETIDRFGSSPKLVKGSDAYFEYLRMLEGYSNKEIFFKIVLSLKSRVNNYFNVIEKNLFDINLDDGDVSLYAFVLAGLNLMQEYMDPVEALTTLKESLNLPTLREKFSSLGNMEILNKTPSSEVAYIPMVVLIVLANQSEPLKIVRKYYEDLFEVETEILLESAIYANEKYSYTKFMKIETAKKLVDKTAAKIEILPSLSTDEMIVYKLQELNGIMTWSKNLLTNKSKNFRRYDSTNNILTVIKKTEFVKKNERLAGYLIPNTISGSEKQAMLIYLLRKLKLADPMMYDQVKIKAMEYYNFSKR